MQPGVSHVPVFVDNTRHAEELGAVRFGYFYVERVEPEAMTYVSSEGAPSILLLDLEGVIVSGLGGKERLDTPEAIRDLFNFLAQRTPYVVTSGYLWLPNALLEQHVDGKLSKGDVVRVYAPLFIQACAEAGPVSELPLDDVPPGVQPVFLSKDETAAFREWTGRAVERVRDRYRTQPQKNLRNR